MDADTMQPIWERGTFSSNTPIPGFGPYDWVDFGPKHINTWTNNTGSTEQLIRIRAVRSFYGAGIEWNLNAVVSAGEDVDCEPLEDSESFGDNESRKGCGPDQGWVADPVNTESGNLHMGLPGVVVKGRQPCLSWGLSYNSLDTGSATGVGRGWSHVYGMRLEEQVDGTIVVHQESGSTVRFWPAAGGWVAPSRAKATLVEHLDGSFTFTRKQVRSFEFDSTGRLTAIGTLHGNETELAYSGSELDYVEDPAGRRLDFTWSGGNVTQITAPGLDSLTPQTVTMTYEPDGDLATYTDTGGGVWSFTYDGSHRMLTMRKPANHGGGAGAVVENHYDTEGRVVWQDDELDHRATIAYDTPAAGQTTSTDPEGRVRVDSYVDGVRTEMTVAPGTAQEATWKFDYDMASLGVVREEDPNGHVTTHGYDGAGNRVRTVGPDGEVRYTAEFGALDLPVWVEDGEGHRTEYVWDSSNGNLLSVTANADAEDGDPARTTTYTYGDAGRPEDVTAITDPEGKVWSYSYDPDTGDRLSEEDPEGNVTGYVYNDAGWLISTVSPRGNAPGATPADHTTVFGHDAAGRTVSVTEAEGGTSEQAYNAGGQLVWSEDPSDDRTEYTYDIAGRVTVVERPDATTLESTYWDDGSLKTRIDGAGAVTGYVYDAAGRVSTVTDPLDRVTTYAYDLEGRPTWVQAHGGDCTATPAARCTSFSYNTEDEVTGIVHSDDGGTTTPDVTDIVYDGNGRRIAMTDGTGTSSWDWNPSGELEATTAGNGDTLTYTYDRRGLQTSVTYPGAKTVTRAFDDAGRWTGLGDWLGDTGTFGYDENSNLEQITYPTASGNVDTFTFDQADRLSGINYAQDAASLGAIAYGRDDHGRVETADATGLPGVDEAYEYSPLDQLAKVNADVLGYDAADNLTVRSDGATQAFDAANQLCWASPSGATGACGSAPVDATVFDYDDSGNRTAEHDAASGLTSSLGYDSANRLISATVPSGAGPQGQFHPVSPARVLDTRDGTGSCDPSPCARLRTGAVGHTVSVDVAGVGGLPASGVDAVVVNLTVVGPSSAGFVTAFASGTSRPGTSNVNYNAGQIIGNAATVKVGSDGRINIYSAFPADVVVDVQGWYSAPDGATGGGFTALGSPTRVLDTRTATRTGDCSPATCATLTPNGSVTFQVTGRAGVPDRADVAAVVANVTVINAVSNGLLRVYPAGEPVPSGTTLNHSTGDVLSQMVIAKIGAGGRVTIRSVAATNVIVDIQGYFSSGDLADATAFHPRTPTRLFDTRTSTGAATCVSATCDGLTNGETITLDLTGVAGLPDEAIDAVVVSVAVTNTTTTGFGHIQLHPAGTPPPSVSSLLFQNGETLANSVTTRLNADNQLNIRASAGTADVFIDIQGWYSKATHTFTYAYDGDGYRSTKTAPDGTTTGFTWDRSNPIPKLLTEQTAAGRTYVIYGPGGHPYAQITGTDITYYHRDQLGSTRLTTNTTGDPVGTYTYDPYGKLTHHTGTGTPLLGFAGEYTDTETGYTYLRARHYDPHTAQFLTRDPIEQQTGDAYGYAGGNPASYTDPTGLCPMCWVAVPIIAEVALSAWDAYDAYDKVTDPCASSAEKWAAVGAAVAGIGLPGNYGWADDALDAARRTPRAIGPAGDAAASGLSRMDRFRNLADTGFEVGGQHYTINPHALTRLRASGRRHIDPESLIRSLDTVPTPGTPGSRIFTDPRTGTRWIVNDANDVISPWPAGFKG